MDVDRKQTVPVERSLNSMELVLSSVVHTVLFLQKSSVSVPASFSPITVTFFWNRPIVVGCYGRRNTYSYIQRYIQGFTEENKEKEKDSQDH